LLNAVGGIDPGQDGGDWAWDVRRIGMATVLQHSNLKAGSKGRT